MSFDDRGRDILRCVVVVVVVVSLDPSSAVNARSVASCVCTSARSSASTYSATTRVDALMDGCTNEVLIGRTTRFGSVPGRPRRRVRSFDDGAERFVHSGGRNLGSFSWFVNRQLELLGGRVRS